MKKNIRKRVVYLAMFVFVLAGYHVFYNTAYFGDELRDEWWDHWSSSTIKFTNNWLKEGACNLHFLMLEKPESIEYDNFEREPYISYPPGAIIPPYLLAKILHKDQIQIDFMRQFLAINYFLDTFLVCLLFFAILTYCLKIKQIKWAAVISVVLSICWMCLPVNLWCLRNVYFSDECVIPVVLLFIWMEIYDTYFRNKSLSVRYLYLVLKFIVALAGVLTDYYFLFVVFVAWLIKIAPLLQSRKIKPAIIESLVYVLPVLAGLLLFFMQISTVPDYRLILKAKMQFRTFSSNLPYPNWAVVCKHFFINYDLIGVLLVIGFFVISIKSVLSKKINKDYLPFVKVLLLIWIPPVLHALVFQNHTANHELSMVKFALPFILTLFIILYYTFKRYKNTVFFYPLLIAGFIGTLTLIDLSYFNNYYKEKQAGNYELGYLVKDNSRYEDVYFSFTDSIDFYPPIEIAVSNKLVYKIDDVSDITRLFPNLDTNAHILFVIRKNNNEKEDEIIEKESNIINNSSLSVENEDYIIRKMN